MPLAPKMVSQEEEDPECPICFMNYEALNKTVCCKAAICTNCFLQMKNSRVQQSNCPFCTVDMFNVTYSEQRRESAAASDKDLTPEKIDRKSPPTTTPSNANSSSGKKSPAMPVPTSSKEERKALESQIQQQRAGDRSYHTYETRSSSYANTPARSTNSRFHASSSSSGNRRGLSNHASGSSTLRQQSRERALLQSLESNGYDSDDIDDDGLDMLRSIFFGNRPTPSSSRQQHQQREASSIMSAARLEEMMLEEAIKLSIAEAEVNAEKEKEEKERADNGDQQDQSKLSACEVENVEPCAATEPAHTIIGRSVEAPTGGGICVPAKEISTSKKAATPKTMREEHYDKYEDADSSQAGNSIESDSKVRAAGLAEGETLSMALDDEEQIALAIALSMNSLSTTEGGDVDSETKVPDTDSGARSCKVNETLESTAEIDGGNTYHRKECTSGKKIGGEAAVCEENTESSSAAVAAAVAGLKVDGTVAAPAQPSAEESLLEPEDAAHSAGGGAISRTSTLSMDDVDLENMDEDSRKLPRQSL